MATSSAAATALSETEKIQALIALVESLKDATFVRNGTENDCQAAADHMRNKWRLQQEQIKTARDFVRLVATKSTLSGQPYLIRAKDGKQITSEQFLLGELAKLEPAAQR